MTANAGPRPVHRHRWCAALAGLRADALDCLQTTLALIADDAHGRGTHLRLGSRWSMPGRQADATTGVQPGPEQRLAQARDLLGLRIGQRHDPCDLARLCAAGPVYVVADAFALPWLPYHRRSHMDHGFLVESRVDDILVVDPYHNDTPWGPARPGAWALSARALRSAVGENALVASVELDNGPPALDTTAALADNAQRARAAAPGVERYVAERRERLVDPEVIRGLVLDVWLLGRERRLHTAWLGPDHPVAAAAIERAGAWEQLAAHSFLALRRLERGGSVQNGLIDDIAEQLRADIRFAQECLDRSIGGPDPALAAAVRGALGATLGLDDRDVNPQLPLRSLSGFDSFQLVRLIDRVERTLGVLLPSDVAADELTDIDGLCRAFARGSPASA